MMHNLFIFYSILRREGDNDATLTPSSSTNYAVYLMRAL